LIAVDTNLLVYAHRTDSEWHERAAACIRDLAEARTPWAILWPCIHEFLAIATDPKIWDPPTPASAARDQVEAWLESPSLVLLAEGPEHWSAPRAQIEAGRVAGDSSGIPPNDSCVVDPSSSRSARRRWRAPSASAGARSVRFRQPEGLLGDVAKRELLRHRSDQGQDAFAQAALDVVLRGEAEAAVGAHGTH